MKKFNRSRLRQVNNLHGSIPPLAAVFRIQEMLNVRRCNVHFNQQKIVKTRRRKKLAFLKVIHAICLKITQNNFTATLQPTANFLVENYADLFFLIYRQSGH